MMPDLIMRLALFQPDIPQNTGTMLRLAACLDVPIDIIEPCGFAFSEKSLRRAGMDYMDHVDLTQHRSWDHFQASISEQSARLILLTTRASTPYIDVTYEPNDILLLGRESAGVPDEVHNRADQRVLIPMAPHARSLNVAVSAGIVLTEALRQTKGFPAA